MDVSKHLIEHIVVMHLWACYRQHGVGHDVFMGRILRFIDATRN